MTTLPQYLHKDIFRKVGEIADERHIRAFVIGGYVRDCFLGRARNDIDIVVEGSGIDFAKAVGASLGVHVSYFKNFGTAMLRYKGDEVEFVGARKESYRRESRKPIVENGTLEDDQKRRDFTINAMALSLNKASFGELVDPFGGIRDLSDGIIRTPLDPVTTFSDDPLRMLRAVRFVAQLSTAEQRFRIVSESFEAMKSLGDRLSILSVERITEELDKMFLSPKPSVAFFLLEDTGLLRRILPEVSALKGVETVEGKGHKENFSHSLMVLDNVAATDGPTPKLYLRWAALLHDIGKPASKRFDPALGWTFHGHDLIGSRMVPGIFRRLKMPIDAMKYVRKLVWLHLRPIALVDEGVTDSAVRRLLFDAGDDIDDLMILCKADVTSKNPAKVARIRANFALVEQKLREVEEKDRIRNMKNPITGEYIMQLYGIGPCKEIGILKDAVKEAILDAVIPNEFEAADKFMRAKAAQLGLREVRGSAPKGTDGAPAESDKQ